MGRLRGFLRDALLLLLAFSLVLGTAAAYAQNWPPAVIVESSSMMHRDAEVGFGRVGTIDPGDLVLVKGLDAPSDVETLVENGPERYGLPGDVIVYRRTFSADPTPIIHRAIAYVEVHDAPEGQAFRVRWDPAADCVGGATKDPADPAWCVYDAEGGVRLDDVPAAGVRALFPTHDGFVTKGDNPVTNADTDQALGISRDAEGEPEVVALEQIEGKARGEMPWLGLVKLAMAPQPNEAHPPASYVQVGNAWAPLDLWVMLALSLGVLLGTPLVVDAVKSRRARRNAGK